MNKPTIIASVEAQARMRETFNRVIDARELAYTDAIHAIAKYKFWMFGYHAGQWVMLNRLLKDTPYHQGNPFRVFVEIGQMERGELADAKPHEVHRAKLLRAKWGEEWPDKVVEAERDRLTAINTPSIVHSPTNTHETGETHGSS